MSGVAPPPTVEQQTQNATLCGLGSGKREINDILQELESSYPEHRQEIEKIRSQKEHVGKKITKRKKPSNNNSNASTPESSDNEQQQQPKKTTKKKRKDMPDFTKVEPQDDEKKEKVVVKTLNIHGNGFMNKLRNLHKGTTAFLTGAYVDSTAKISAGSHSVMEEIGTFAGDVGRKINLVLHIGTKSNKISWTDLLSNESSRGKFLKGVNDNVKKYGIRSVAIDFADGLSTNPGQDILNIVLQKIGTQMFIPVTAKEITTKSTNLLKTAALYDENKLKFFIPDADYKNIDDLVHSEFESARGKQTYVMIKTCAEMHDADSGEFVHSYPRHCVLSNKHIDVDGEHVTIRSRNYRGRMPTRKTVKDVCKQVKRSKFAGVVIGDSDDDVKNERASLEGVVNQTLL